MSPFGLQPEGSDPSCGERGQDTMNRLLLHGARHHNRRAVFETASDETPDWRADRHSIRIGLALREGLAVGPGDVVALWMPLSVEWALVERGLWGLGATSLPLWPEWSASDVSRTLAAFPPKVVFAPSETAVLAVRLPPVVTAVVTLAEPSEDVGLRDLLERGGVLDTAERASAFRATARQIPPEALASIEPDSAELSHAAWVRRVGEVWARDPPAPGKRRILSGGRPDLSARIALYAGWSDGFSTVVFDL